MRPDHEAIAWSNAIEDYTDEHGVVSGVPTSRVGERQNECPICHRRVPSEALDDDYRHAPGCNWRKMVRIQRNFVAYGVADPLVEYDDGECAIIDGYDWTEWETGHTTLAALECVRSFDHGARTAEELDMDRCTDGAARIMSPVLALMLPAGAPWHPGLAEELAMACIVEEYRVERSSGLWYCDDPDDTQGLFELWDYHVEPALGDAGYIVETSADAGMTWIYRPMEDVQ